MTILHVCPEPTDTDMLKCKQHLRYTCAVDHGARPKLLTNTHDQEKKVQVLNDNHATEKSIPSDTGFAAVARNDKRNDMLVITSK